MIEECKYNFYKEIFYVFASLRLFKPRIIQVNVKISDSIDDYVRRVIVAAPWSR